MSAASSYEESTQPNTEIAQETDRRLLFVAQNLPPYAFRGADGESIVICQQINVGELSCTNTGAQTMEVAVKLYGHSDQLGFWKEYGLPTGALGRPREKIDLIDSSPSSAEDFEDCPDVGTFMRGFDVLFAKFVAELPSGHQQPAGGEQQIADIVYLADHQAG